MPTSSSILPAPGETIIFEAGTGTNADARFVQVCQLFPTLRIEQDSEGNVLVMSPTGGKSSRRNNAILFQLTEWAQQNGTGSVFESNVLFVLPDNAKRGPDAAWVSNETLRTVPPDQEDDYLRVVPEFIIELRSKTDRLSRLQTKMQNWMSQGVQLAWLIDADQRQVWIYRQTFAEPELVSDPAIVEGEGPLDGFRLRTAPIWQGLRG